MPALFGRFSRSTEAVLMEAQRMSEQLGTPMLSNLIVAAMLVKASSPATDLLKNSGLDLQKVSDYIVASKEKTIIRNHPPFNEVRSVLEEAMKIAGQFRFNFVEVEHLLYVISSDTRLTGYQLLVDLKIDPKTLVSRLNEWMMSVAMLSAPPQMGPNPNRSQSNIDPEMPFNHMRPGADFPDLDKYLFDVTEANLNHDRDPVIGRDKEIAQIEAILLRRQKNNPLLLGEAGVGKTAIVDGLAQHIVQKKVPRALINKRIMSLDLGLVVAGTMYRGQFEERLKGILQEVQEIGDIILFIDEIHTLTGAGSAEGSFDAANILKPALARGEISVIGATTHEEYRKNILKDRALDRRFQVVNIEEPDIKETIRILKGIKKELELYHQVKIKDEAIVAAAELSTRYIHDRFLPDKAIDVLDQACALHAEAYSGPTLMDARQAELDVVEREKFNLIQAADPNRESDWQTIKNLDARKETLLKAIVALEELDEKRLPRVEISATDISQVIADRTKIPLTDIQQSLRPVDIKKIKSSLEKHILGQSQAIKIISQSLMRSQLGLNQGKKPTGSFLLVGPTGVGKTETARVLAREIFGDSRALIKVDMSEYMERHNVSNLIGAPAGYIGYDKGGNLTEQVRKRPYAVVLFDEIEKAHPDVFNLFLQILEEGELTDNSGMVISFEHTLIIMTSNIGMKSFNQVAHIGFQAGAGDLEAKKAELENHLNKEIKSFFRPEFLGRLSAVIHYQPLDKETVAKLLQKRLQELWKKLKKKGIEGDVSKAAFNWLVEQYNPEAGARSIERLFLEIIDPLIIQSVIDKPDQKILKLDKLGDGLKVL